MTKLLLFSFLLITATYGIAQDSLFSKAYASLDHDYIIKAQTRDGYGNIAQVGQADLNQATYTYLDSLGNVLFSKEYSWNNSPSNGLQFRKIKPTSDGNFIAVGDFFMPDQSANVGICAKLDSAGSILWSEIVVPFNPIFFRCSDVLESAEHTFWITGQDEQSGELSVLEVDQNGGQLQSYSFANTGFRLENRKIMEIDSNLVLVGAQLNQSGGVKGHILTLDKTGNTLWSKTYDGVRFLDAANDTNSIWIASNYNGKMSISTISHDGSPINLIDYGHFLDNMENIGFCILNDSTLAFGNGSNLSSNLIVARANSPEAIRTFPMLSISCLSPGDHGTLYVAGNGPMYGVKSMNNPYPHSALMRMDSALTELACNAGPGPLTITNVNFTANNITLTSVQASSVNTASLTPIDQVLESYIGCVDFYGGIDENDPNNLTVFPNPAKDFIRLQFENATSGVVEIMTMDGKVVQQSKVAGNNASVSVSKLVEGTYMYRFTSSKNAVSRGKLIIEN